MKDIVLRLLLRWAVNTAGLWIATQFVASVDYGDSIWVLVISALLLSVINASLKPLLTVLSLPFIALSLGLFTVVVNGVLIWLVSVLIDQFTVGNFTGAVLAGLIIGLVNYMLTNMLDRE